MLGNHSNIYHDYGSRIIFRFTNCTHLTSIMWPYCWLKFTAHRGHAFFGSWPLTKYWFFDWIMSSYLVKLLKTGQDCRKAVNANPELKVKQSITISCMRMFFVALFWGRYKSQTRSTQITNLNKNSFYPRTWHTTIEAILIQILLVPLPNFRSSPLTKSLEQAHLSVGREWP